MAAPQRPVRERSGDKCWLALGLYGPASFSDSNPSPAWLEDTSDRAATSGAG